MRSVVVRQNYYILLDSPSMALLTMSTSVAPIMFLFENIPDTQYALSVEYPHYGDSYAGRFFLAALRPKNYPRWTWNGKARKFARTKTTVKKSLVEKSRLAESKRAVIARMMQDLSAARYGLQTGVGFQETVYLHKKFQAQQYKDTGYDESEILKYPYVAQYADFAGTSLRQAADDILLKAQFDEDILLKTEFLRLAYFDEVRKATRPDELPRIYEAFTRDAFTNALV